MDNRWRECSSKQTSVTRHAQSWNQFWIKLLSRHKSGEGQRQLELQLQVTRNTTNWSKWPDFNLTEVGGNTQSGSGSPHSVFHSCIEWDTEFGCPVEKTVYRYKPWETCIKKIELDDKHVNCYVTAGQYNYKVSEILSLAVL